jgi:hypothetical protein
MRSNLLVPAAIAFFVGAGVALPHEIATPSRASARSDSSEVVGPSRLLPAPAGLRVARAVLRGVGIENLSRAGRVQTAVDALAGRVREQSHPQALKLAFEAYYNFRAAHPEKVRKPYLYFVDFGLDSHTPRGYVFDMDHLQVVDGPFTVAHGRGSGSKDGIPTRFSNRHSSAATSLGLFLAQEVYGFVGHDSGRPYRSIGMRLNGLSGSFNSAARDRGVVVHGAPYVTPSGAGRSQGCPAMERDRAERLIPQISNGGMVFLFSPNDPAWLANDPWLRDENGPGNG